ncbi:GumC family protein [Lutispora sp.]|uniref:GumC family protein n=1 Tax=Lutispora sp. TaxID=2828727 RepID=UPI002B1F0389|nr:Wzz/FepE/Etk N-terminal domain-containing protein [Lutispora sp.]MEA4963991.1 Wzz/FepE/Etk N-terminal domain-containing protein [Lutispora sp.]
MEEISLRELIEILLKRKKIIAIITAITIIASGVISFLVLEPVYEAKAILMASGINAKAQPQSGTQGIEELLNNISQYPQMSIEAYKEQIKNPQILNQVIDELDLDEQGITRVHLRDMITLNTIKDTNLITISVKNEDKVLAANIANTVAKKFTIHVSEIAKAQADKSSNYIKSQLEVEKINLDEALLEYKNYLSQPQGLIELQKEVDSKTDLITQYKTDLLDEEIEEKKMIASLRTANEELEKTSEKIVLNKSIADDPLLTQYASDKENKTTEDVLNINLQSEEINGLYTNLKSQINDYEIRLSGIRAKKEALVKTIEETRNDLETLQADLAEKQHQEDIIKQKVDFTRSTYESFLKKYEETRILKSSDIGEASIIMVSPAVEPLKPVEPRKMFNLSVAAVLGLMLGVFAAFFIEYWKTSGVEVKKSNVSID